MIEKDNRSKVTINLESDLESHPRCIHGPTLLFTRGEKKFYACSAFRERKECDFYQNHGEVLSQKKMARIKQTQREFLKRNDFSESFQTILNFRKSTDTSTVNFCQTCSRVKKDSCEKHSVQSLSKDSLKCPVSVLSQKSQDKKEAQYFFSESTRNFILSSILAENFTHVLCIGCPSIFEKIEEIDSVRSLLLDIDARFGNFYDNEKFLWCNYFNGHFFNGSADKESYRNFLIESEKILLLIDPPFGAKTELISHSIDRTLGQVDLFNMKAEVEVMWIFPYFMERQVMNSKVGLRMSDFRVTYREHKQYGEKEGGRNLGSPVRIFTSLPLSNLPLPGPDYHHCDHCKHWVHSSNKHCQLCGSCPSKDGRTYQHCGLCERCVKPTYQHCDQCNRCCLPHHACHVSLHSLKRNQGNVKGRQKKRRKN